MPSRVTATDRVAAVAGHRPVRCRLLAARMGQARRAGPPGTLRVAAALPGGGARFCALRQRARRAGCTRNRDAGVSPAHRCCVMPIYEYQCPACGRVFEEWVKVSEAHREEPCPDCGTPSPRIISRTSFVLKGDGWYVSDYGYRKGITEDGGTGAEPPARSTPTAPAPQGEKALAKTAPDAGSAGKGSGTPKAAASATAGGASAGTAGAASAPASGAASGGASGSGGSSAASGASGAAHSA